MAGAFLTLSNHFELLLEAIILSIYIIYLFYLFILFVFFIVRLKKLSHLTHQYHFTFICLIIYFSKCPSHLQFIIHTVVTYLVPLTVLKSVISRCQMC